MEKERFTMLLLDPGEIFFEDFSVQIKLERSTDSKQNQWLDGRLKLCSKSLVFVSKDINQPLIKIQLKDTNIAEKCNSNDGQTGSNDILLVYCKQYIEMLKGNVLAPYKFVHEPTNFLFSFNYAKVDDCLPQMSQLLRAATLPTAEQNSMIMAIVHSRQSRFSFDTSWLEDLYEQVVFEVQANKVLPLVINPGRILLTTCRIYFQPYNNMDQYPVLKINLKDIKNVIKRRFLLRQVGLEIQWTRQSDNKDEYFFLSMKNQEDRDALYTNLLSQSALKIETIHQNHMTMQWQNGSLSNYDYLLYVNSLADRTFHDLTQYPVMPWVLQNYSSHTLDLNDPNVYRDLSKPIGALEPKRLERLKTRYSEMSEPKFLYGSHYSAPGFVLFYLVRKYPHYMLCLQNGRFDHPDRMFNSVADVWKNVLVNMSDFKELIPEFYDTASNGDFLINNFGIDFGFRHDGTKIADVYLPPWAENPSNFVHKLRNALESDWVSKNLNHWIDLIFGYKQKGEEAIKANNVFFHLCYEGAIDLDTIKDVNDRHGLEVQIMEFGQIPKQIFKLPHPKRLIAINFIRSETCFSIQQTSLSENKKMPIIELNNSITFQSHKEAVSAVIIIADGMQDENLVSVGRDGVLKIYSLKTGKLTRSIALSSVPLCSCAYYQTLSNANVLVVGSYDNSLIFYDIEFGKIFDIVYGHEDAISCLAYSKINNIIISSSWDCTTKIWRTSAPDKKIKLVERFVAELHHDSQVTCMNISRDETLLISGTEDGEVFLWKLDDSYSLQFSVKQHTSKINAITFESESKNIISCASNKLLSVIDVQTSTQTYLRTLEEEPICLAWISSYLLIGDSNGDLLIWDPQSAAFISKFQCHQGPLISLTVSLDNKKVITGGQDKKVIVWDCIKN
ncbi:PREDICTED: protein FAN-like [Ceratosolen solmsi marchali]|uniref:Protein FAN-like n=1 Tax=Ceratosolen solmsi marchali TaxID=326594 RepID=A0AAJ6VK28_9HYME|nr:PREDICTED: protein FAN-like [Ceratosolen solmsi marchali]